ncbi:MAG: hypothetical protein IAF58_10075 [Leptolyngbya sp.]|nr:hypothetical protein [Candidatus Melainabacteria bacterium]
MSGFEEYQELIAGGAVAAGGLFLLALFFFFGHMGNAVDAVKAGVTPAAPIQQIFQPARQAHVAPAILNDNQSTGRLFITEASVTSKFGRPRQY